MPRQIRNSLLASLVGVAALTLCAAPCLALDDPGDFDREQIQAVPAHLLPGTSEESAREADPLTAPALVALDPFRFAGLTEKLHALPFRPVVIGESPRIPYDPDPGVGLVFRIPLPL
ncbi:MAG: hypothetical protein NZ990_12045 [Myxococcota bacterium]|nr:hypothetical protein [Myxococcota bacterium]